VTSPLTGPDVPVASDIPTTKAFDPTYGPQLPRIYRDRLIRTFDSEDYANIGYYYNGTGGARFTQPLSLGKPTLLRLSSCIDTVRNKNFRGSRNLILDDGGELTIRKSWWTRNSVSFSGINPGGYFFEGDLGLGWAARSFDGAAYSDLPPQSDVDDIVGYGAQAWNKFKPARPNFQLGLSIAELRDVPKLLHASLDGIKHISDYFLAVQFGWKPLLADIRNMINFVDRASKQLDFLQANVGKPIKRKGSVFYDATSGHLEHPGELQMWNVGGGGYNGLPYLPSAWSSSERWTYMRNITFAGEYVFYIKDVALPQTRKHLAAALSGAILTPADLWDGLPWSWLIDWFANTSDVIHNLTDHVADRQISNYAYIMGKTTRSITETTTDGNFSPSLTRNYVTIVRRKVDPFRPDVGGELTPLRIAILIALGIAFIL